jgi:Rps23 Pro-64 3,4-dihydroxylase Tpa1-like proline 4-hydroxylase
MRTWSAVGIVQVDHTSSSKQNMYLLLSLLSSVSVSVASGSHPQSSSSISPRGSYPSLFHSPQFYEDILKLNAVEIYRQNQPIPHIYIDNFFPEKILRDVVAEFPSSPTSEADALSGDGAGRTSPWFKSEINCQFLKLEITSQNFGPATNYLISNLQSSTFIRFLERLTGISSLIPDPHHYGGGPHQTLSGGHLSLHLDYNFNEFLQLWRRVNVFVYLNEDWDDSWGGHLELWDANRTALVTALAPLFNRLVVFTASEVSWHGHPEPLKCPLSRQRNSLALYFYTAEDGNEGQGPRQKRQTDFRPRKEDDWRVGEQYHHRGS